jgi:hypothetical protein
LYEEAKKRCGLIGKQHYTTLKSLYRETFAQKRINFFAKYFIEALITYLFFGFLHRM